MSSPQRRPRAVRGSGATVREEILEAAYTLLSETGSVDRISLRSIAREVGVTPMALYRYFDDLTSIVIAVKLRHYEEFLIALDDAIASADTADRSPLYALANAYLQFGIDRPGAYQVLFSTRVDEPPVTDGRKIVGRRAREVFLETVADYLGVRPGDELAWTKTVHLWTALHGITHLRATCPSIDWPDPAEQITAAVDLLFP